MRQNNDRRRSDRDNFAPSNRRNRGYGNNYMTAQNMRRQAPANPCPNPVLEQPELIQQLNSQTIGERGPALFQDIRLHEALAEFVHQPRIPRVLFTKGYGVFGHFQAIRSMSEYTTAGFLQEEGIQTPVSVRFSTAFGGPHAADTSRNLRGFSTKFYTAEGNFDLLCSHLPVSFVRDAIRMPDALQRMMPSPATNLVNPERMWSLFADYPESVHMLMWFFSDNGTVKSFRQIRGHSVCTYVWINGQGKRHYVRYQWIPAAGEQYITAQEAVMLAGQNPDAAGLDLHTTIAQGTPVEFDLHVQLMDPADESALAFDPLDSTKIWDETSYPPVCAGRMTLYSNPLNYLEQVEKLAFDPANLVPGIEFSDDKLLQGSAHIFADAQRYRLGPDYKNAAVNKSKTAAPVRPLSFGDGRQITGTITRSSISRQDDFSQAGKTFAAFSAHKQNRLIENISASLTQATESTTRTVLSHLNQASPELVKRLQEPTGLH